MSQVGLSMLVNGISSVAWGAVNDKLGVFGTTSTGALLLFIFLIVTSVGQSPSTTNCAPFANADTCNICQRLTFVIITIF